MIERWFEAFNRPEFFKTGTDRAILGGTCLVGCLLFVAAIYLWICFDDWRKGIKRV